MMKGVVPSVSQCYVVHFICVSIQDIESGPDNGHLCGPQPSCLSNHQSSIIKESNLLTKQNYSSRIITMDSPSMMTEVVEVYLRQIQAEQSCRPWSEVKWCVMRNGQAAFNFFDKSSVYGHPLHVALSELGQKVTSLTLDEYFSLLTHIVEDLLKENRNDAERDYAPYANEFLGMWKIFYGIVTSKWPEARIKSQNRSAETETLCAETTGKGVFCMQLWNEAINSAVLDSRITKLEGHQIIISALEANLQESNDDKWERFWNLLRRKFLREQYTHIKEMLRQYYGPVSRNSERSNRSASERVTLPGTEENDSSTRGKRSFSNASQVSTPAPTSVSTRAASRKRSYEELNHETAALLPAATSSSPSASTTLAQPATAAVSVGARASAATASAALPTSTAENEEVPLKMRVEILRFLTKYGDAANKKEAMRQLMTMATRK